MNARFCTFDRCALLNQAGISLVCIESSILLVDPRQVERPLEHVINGALYIIKRFTSEESLPLADRSAAPSHNSAPSGPSNAKIPQVRP